MNTAEGVFKTGQILDFCRDLVRQIRQSLPGSGGKFTSPVPFVQSKNWPILIRKNNCHFC